MQLVLDGEPAALATDDAIADDLMAALRAAVPVWVPLAAIGDGRLLAEHPREDIAAALEQLQDEGLVDLWPDSPDGPAAIISSLGAERLGLVMWDDAGDKRTCWLGKGDRPPQIRERAGQRMERDSAEAMDDVADSRLGLSVLDLLAENEERWGKFKPPLPDDEETVKERLDRQRRRERARKNAGYWKHWMYPAFVPPAGMRSIGANAVGWSLAHEPAPGEPCIVCGGSIEPADVRVKGGRTVIRGERTYCLGCLRSSMDHVLIADPLPVEPPPEKEPAEEGDGDAVVFAVAAAPAAAGLKGGIG